MARARGKGRGGWRGLSEAALKARLSTPSPKARKTPAAAPLIAKPRVTVLGIDPGSRLLGFGLLERRGAQAQYLHSGTLKAQGEDYLERLAYLNREVFALMAIHQPDEVVIEKAFVSKNSDSALKLGQVRGMVMSAALSVNAHIHEYTPRTVKQSVTGLGSAQKAAVQRMVGLILKLDQTLQADEADALAVALCHVNAVHRVRLLGE
jgi:crossover junction endodeoxyribonuclease RuvC